MAQTNNPFNFKAGSVALEIYSKYSTGNQIDSNINLAALASQFNCTKGNIRAAIRKVKKHLLVTSEDLETQPISNINTNNATIIKVYEEEGDVTLYIKTCKEFEDYLKANKEIRTTSNLWGQGQIANFYHLQLVDNYSDDIHRKIIHNGIINFATLRIKGISEGVTFKLDGLLTQKQLKLSVKKLHKVFSTFYKTKILGLSNINIEATLEVENEN